MTQRESAERKFVRRLMKADAQDLSQILNSSDPDEQRTLKRVLGSQRVQRMQSLARRYESKKNLRKLGTVFLLPGILGSQLWDTADQIWLDIFQIIEGKFDRLQVEPSGASQQRILALDYLAIVYGELELSLAADWTVIKFPYDWRLDLRQSAQQLKKLMDQTVGSSEPLYFVVHSMGSLVVRSMLQQYPSEVDRLKRFPMLACQNYGTFAIPLLYFGSNDVFNMIAVAQMLVHSRKELTDWVKEYVGTYQPFVERIPAAARLCDPSTYGPLNPRADRFSNALCLQRELRQGIEVPCPSQNPLVVKMTAIVGYGFPTAYDVRSWSHLDSRWSYRMTDRGDGNIAHILSVIQGVPTYFVNERHDWVPANTAVIDAVPDILENSVTDRLPASMPKTRETSSFLLHIRRLLQEKAAVMQLLFAIVAAHFQRRRKPEEHTWGEARAQYLLYGGNGAARYHR